MRVYLDFEHQISNLDSKIEDLRHISDNGDINIASEIRDLEDKRDSLLKTTYKDLSAWDVVKVARHLERPHFKDYILEMFEDFVQLSGDRCFGEDKALLCGLARFEGISVVVLGHEKGSTTETRMYHNFGSARPEGYRKAKRVMDLAEKFGLPIISLVDTAGAYPAVGAEERGQAEAIATSIEKCLKVRVPFVSVIIGEGGSGGAIAIAASDRVLMLENSIYSVISPEGCASILWHSSDYTKDACEALKMTSKDLYELGVIDEIISEPIGGAHRHQSLAISNVKAVIYKHLQELQCLTLDELLLERSEKYLRMGVRK